MCFAIGWSLVLCKHYFSGIKQRHGTIVFFLVDVRLYTFHLRERYHFIWTPQYLSFHSQHNNITLI